MKENDMSMEKKETIKVCSVCKRKYKSERTKQTSFDRDIEEDICPYCSSSNGSSMSWKFTNFIM